MNRLVALLAEHGGLLALGLTIWLALGAAAMRLVRAPIHALRIGEATLLLALLWAGLACVPFNRYSPEAVWGDVRGWLAMDDDEAREIARPSMKPANDDNAIVEQRTLPLATRRSEFPRRTDGGQRLIAPVLRPAWRVRPTVVLQPVEPARPVEVVHRTVPGTGPSHAAVKPIVPRTPSTRESTASTATTNRPWLTPRWLAAAYLVGSGLAIGWLLFGRLALRRLERGARPADPWLNGLYASVLPAGIGRRPRLLVSDRCGRPLSFGVWRPVILLPRSLCHRHHAGALRHVLRHELAHVGQRDAWGHLLFNVAFPLCYFHPLYWWLRARAGLCRELIADDQAAACTDKRAYVSDLLDVARQWQRRCDARLGALGVFESSSQFYRRMTMLCERERPLDRRCGWWWRGGLLTVGCLAAALLGLTLGRPAAAGDDPLAASLLALADDDDRDDDDRDDEEADEEARDEADDEEGESDEEARDEKESESEEGDDDSEEESDDESDEEAEDDDEDAEEEESDEDSDDEEDESDEEESDDEESEEDSDDDEGDDEEEDMAEDEGDLDELMAEKEEIANRLAELEATIEEAAARRAQRDAERESAAEAEARREAEEAETGQWQNLMETLERLSEQQDRLQQTVSEMSERIEELTRDKEALSEEVNSLRERLAESDEADDDEERDALDDDESDASDDDDESDEAEAESEDD